MYSEDGSIGKVRLSDTTSLPNTFKTRNEKTDESRMSNKIQEQFWSPVLSQFSIPEWSIGKASIKSWREARNDIKGF